MRLSLAGPLGLIALAVSLPVAAAELSEVVVTANRLPQAADDVLAATTVITRGDIETRQARSIEDLLQGVDGIAISNSGGPGKLTSFFVRGTDADQLLVLVDGVRIGSATAGTAALQNIPVEMIERIEFVRGPRSSLYGSEAIGGVLQVFTRRGGGPLRPEASVSGGSLDTRQAHVALGGGDAGAWVQAQAAWQSTDGIDACRGSSVLGAGCFAEEPDRDGYRYKSVSLRAGAGFDSGTSVEASLLRAASRVAFDGYADEFFATPNRSRLLQQTLGATLTQSLAGMGELTLAVGRAWDSSDDYRDAAWQGEFNTRRDNASLKWDVSPAAGHTLTLGADYLDDHVTSAIDYDVRSRNDTGIYAQYLGGIGRWRVEASLRGDDNEQFGRHGTGSAALGYAFAGTLQLVTQYGTGFRAPTFNELYWPEDPFFGPAANPLLDPERSRSIEVALRGGAPTMHWRVSLYETRFRDLIALDGFFLPANIEAARIRGVEAGATAVLDGWRIEAGATLQNAENRSSDANRGNDLTRRPRTAGHLDVERRVGIALLGARLVAEGRRFDDAGNSRRIGGYGTLDLRAEAPIAEQWRMQLRAANVFDKRYETIAYYNQPGRALYLTLRYAAAR